MKKQLDLDSINVVGLTLDEKVSIQGGTYQSGHAAGVFVRKCLDDWGVLDMLYTAAKMF